MALINNLTVVILAAGQGTRMNSQIPKVLHEIGNLPLLGHVLNSVETLKPHQTLLVLSPDLPLVESYAQAHTLHARIIYQNRPLGTGDATLKAVTSLGNFEGLILILYGDTPLLRAETLAMILQEYNQLSEQPAVYVVAMNPQDTKHYGRLVVNEKGELLEIVEAKGATQSILDIPLCHSGLMVLDGKHALSLVQSIEISGVSGEYYLTDLVSIAKRKNLNVQFYVAPSAEEFEGVNNRFELAAADAYLQQRWRQDFMKNGVTLMDPSSLHCSFDTRIDQDVKIHPHVFMGPGVSIERGVEIKSFTHLEGVHIKANARIGPFARLRPGTKIHENVHVGNFVELKNTVLYYGTKVNHLTYLGDALVGEKTNIGAGTITCNYDGMHKWQTEIGSHVSMGANSSLVAPLKIGDNAVVGAGSTVTKDVPPGSLCVGRSKQINIHQGGMAYRQRTLQKKRDIL